MCGIVGYIGGGDAVPVIVEGLQRLEYRGYDSAGIAVATRAGGLRVHKQAGRVDGLVATAPKRLKGPVGIGHTRWATHGEPTDANAHPHVDAGGHVAVVHNGIIENAAELRATLLADVAFASETDTEVLAHLIARELDRSGPPVELEDAVRAVLTQVVGAYGIAVIDGRRPDRVVVARNGSPVLLGVGNGEHVVASDAAALVRHTDQVVHLDDREMAVLRADGYRTFTLDAEPTDKRPVTAETVATAFDTAGHADHMHKEVHEQPAAAARALAGRLDHRFATAHLGGIDLTARDVLGLRRVKVLGCGSAYYAGLAGAHLIETLTRIPADAEPASEFRYRNPVIEPDTLYVAVSQSGETFDTLTAVQEVTRKGGRALGIVNAPGSTIARACGAGIYLHAGPEVSLASAQEDAAADAAKRVAGAASAFYVGRVRGYHLALEGAQKLKEVSYVHAEAYPASELKHGPFALVTEDVPTVVLVPDDELWDKNLASIAEVRARRGPLIAVTDRAGDVPGADVTLRVPRTEPELAPVLLAVPLQLLAYHAALVLGRDVGKPRNLAKSVTVEWSRRAGAGPRQ